MGTRRHTLARRRRTLATATILLAAGALSGCGAAGQLIAGPGDEATSTPPTSQGPSSPAPGSAGSDETPSATENPTTEEPTPSDTTDDSTRPTDSSINTGEIEELILPDESFPIGNVTSRDVKYPEDIAGSNDYSDLHYTLNFSYSVPGLPAACEEAVSVVDNFREPAEDFAIATFQGTWPTQENQDASLIIMAVRSENNDEVMKLYDNISTQCERFTTSSVISDAEPFWDGSGTHVWAEDDEGNRVDVYGGGVEKEDLHVVIIAMGLSESDAAKLFEAQQAHFEEVAPMLG